MKKDKLKIYVSYHDNFERIEKNDVYVPIHVGRKTSKKCLDMIGDDTGENISELNDVFCELTAQYWAWKNDKNSKYVGFCHYRRYFFLGESYNKSDLDISNFLHYECIDEKFYKESDVLNLEKLERILDEDVLIVPLKIKTAQWGSKNIFDQVGRIPQINYRINSKTLLFHELLDEYKNAYPELETLFDLVLLEKDYGYFYNIFIVKKELFDGYCEWLFPVLLEFNKKVDYSEYSKAEKRSLAFFAERLFNVYVENLKKQKKINKVVELPVAMLHHSEMKAEVISKKEYPDKRPVFLSVNNKNYIFAAATIKSFCCNIKTLESYCLFIVEEEKLCFEVVDILERAVGSLLQKKVVNLKHDFKTKNGDQFINICSLTHFLFDRILILMAGDLVLKDIEDIYHFDFDGSCALAVNDINNYGSTKTDFCCEKYQLQVLKATPRKYIDPSFMLINTVELNHDVDLGKKLSQFILNGFNTTEKDTFNYALSGKVKIVDYSWNVNILADTSMAPEDLSDAYSLSCKSPVLVSCDIDKLLEDECFFSSNYQLYNRYLPLSVEGIIAWKNKTKLENVETRLGSIHNSITNNDNDGNVKNVFYSKLLIVIWGVYRYIRSLVK